MYIRQISHTGAVEYLPLDFQHGNPNYLGLV